MAEQDDLAKRIRLGIGFVFLILVIFDVIQGHPSEPSARWKWLSIWGGGIADGWGYTVIEAIIGIFFLFLGFTTKR